MNNLVHNFDEIVQRRGSDCKRYNPNVYDENVLPMWIADTDFKVAKPIVENLKKRFEHELYGYPYNDINFEKAIQNWMKIRHGWDIDPSWVDSGTGVVASVIHTIREFSHPGDKIAVMTPLFQPLQEAVINNGRYLAKSEMQLVNGRYEINWESLECCLKNKRTRLMILCNPHNPLCRVYTREELEKISKLCIKYNVLVLVDEVHGDIIYKGYKHIPFGSISKEARDNCITFLNPGKTFNVGGIRVSGVIIANSKIRDRYRQSVKNSKAQGRTIFGQIVLKTAYTECEYYVEQMMEYLQKNVDYVDKFFKEEVPKIKLIKPEGLYLMWLDCRELGLTQKQLIDFFENKAKLILNNGADFGEGGNGFMRWNIASPLETVKEATRRIKQAVNTL